MFCLTTLPLHSLTYNKLRLVFSLTLWFVGEFANCRQQLVASSCISIRLSYRVNASATAGRVYKEFRVGKFCEILWKVQVMLNIGGKKISGTSHEDVSASWHLTEFLLTWDVFHMSHGAKTLHVKEIFPLKQCGVPLNYEKCGSDDVTWRCKCKGKGKGHPCTGTEALYRPYGP